MAKYTEAERGRFDLTVHAREDAVIKTFELEGTGMYSTFDNIIRFELVGGGIFAVPRENLVHFKQVPKDSVE